MCVVEIANNSLYRENVTLTKSHDLISEHGLPNSSRSIHQHSGW